MYKRTITSLVNLSLSSGGLPLFAGYSQSKSRPSKFLSLRNWMVDLTNSALVSWVFTIWVKGLEPMFHPPTAKRVFTAGFLTLMSLNRAYLPKIFVNSEITAFLGHLEGYIWIISTITKPAWESILHTANLTNYTKIDSWADPFTQKNKWYYHFKTMKKNFCYTIRKWYLDAEFLNLYCHSQYI